MRWRASLPYMSLLWCSWRGLRQERYFFRWVKSVFFDDPTFFVVQFSARATFFSGISGDANLRKFGVPKCCVLVPLSKRRFLVCENVIRGHIKKVKWVKFVFRGIRSPSIFFLLLRKRTVLAVMKRNKNKFRHGLSAVVAIAPQGRRNSTIPHHFLQKQSCKNNQKSLTCFLK